jgi:Bacterial SH3 domain
MVRCCITLNLFLSLFLAACNQQPERSPAIGEAFVGPLSINIRQDLTAKAQIVGTAKHGERLEVLQTRRAFSRVRTKQGIEGWTDGKQLLSTQQMTDLRRIAEQSAQLPSQGAATVYETLNVHTTPNRDAPSSHQLTENAVVDVIGHRLEPRVPFQAAAPTAVAKPATAKRKPKTKDKEKDKDKGRSSLPPPPLPPPPGLPPNWLELSASPLVKEKQAKSIKEPPPPPKFDDFSLIRTKDGKAGWVLTSKLSMLIPDEVAQYAEGRRITSYFKLADSQNKEQQKFHWLWTTMPKGQESFEFDQIRVFIYNTRRHRYETAYIERNVKGYYPVTQHPVEVTSRKEKSNVPGFSVIIEDKDGQLVRKTYALEGYRVRVIQSEPWKRLSEAAHSKPFEDLIPSNAPAPEQSLTPPTLWEKTKEKLNVFSGKSK